MSLISFGLSVVVVLDMEVSLFNSKHNSRINKILVLVKVILRARKISRSIFCGTIIIPKPSLSTAVKGLVAFMAGPVDPGVSAFMFLERPKFNAMHIDGDIGGDIVIFQVFDRHGRVHGKQTFSWLLELPGVVDMTIETNMLGVIKLQGRYQTTLHFLHKR